jgi:hypothetical protein
MSEPSEQDGTAIPQFTVESRDDLAELLRRAGNWAERDVGADVIAAEFRDGAAYVEHEIVTKEARADD